MKDLGKYSITNVFEDIPIKKRYTPLEKAKRTIIIGERVAKAKVELKHDIREALKPIYEEAYKSNSAIILKYIEKFEKEVEKLLEK